MANFFTKLFGKNKVDDKIEAQLITALDGVIEKGGLNLTYKIGKKDDDILVDFSGDDAKLLTEKDGMVLDSFQIYLKRLIQNKKTDQAGDIIVDCDGYLEAAANELKELADKLKNIAIQKGQASYVRALPPRDRKTVHRHLADDARIKSQSIGEGFCKKIKITPVDAIRKNNHHQNQRRPNRHQDA